MRRGKILSICLLSLFVISAITSSILVNTNIDGKTQTVNIYQLLAKDANGDKIQDEFWSDIEAKGEYVIDAVLCYDHKITDFDRLRLVNLGVSLSKEVWDLGRRILITTHRDNLETLANLPGISLITSAEVRTIAVAIEGNDFSELAALEGFEGLQIFWGIGCAVIHYYSGIENDIALQGDYSIISDITDFKFYKDETERSESIEFSTTTAETAEQTNATALWDAGYEGSGVLVGIIDTGINAAHAAIAGRVVDAESFRLIIYGYDVDDTSTDDFDGHGSHVAGIIAGDDAVNPDYIGMAPSTEVAMAKVGDPATMLSILAGLDWLVDDKKVDVINFSFGGTDYPGSNPIDVAFSNAVRNKGILIACSAGNEGYDGFYTISSPSSDDDVISVGNLDTTGVPYEIAQTSSKGLTADNKMKPDVLAPGTDIMSFSQIGSNYVSRGGTSMASPHVVGAIALLLEACADQSIKVNPGVIKGALMHTAVPLPSENVFSETLGLIDVGQAWHLIKNAPTVDTYPAVGGCSPNEVPLPWWEELIQGQIAENLIYCVSPFKNSLSLEITGSAAPYVNYELYRVQYTSTFRLIFNITADTPLGIYTGQIDFKYKTYVLDTIDIDFEVVSGGLGKRMLFNRRTTDWLQNHEQYGQYKPFIDDLRSMGYSICEEHVYLDSGVLDQYDAVWLPDPFSYDFPEAAYENYSYVVTYNAWTASEKAALTSYVENGGTVFLCFNGLSEQDISGYGTIIVGNNISTLNDWTTQWGITVSEDMYPGTSPVPVKMKPIHALAAGVTNIDHYGTTLEISGDAFSLTETVDGYEYNTLAVYQHDNGGRVIVMSTNFNLDSVGYINNYNLGETQNDIYGQNLVRWATAEHRIRRQNITAVDKTITLKYEYLAGPGADFGGYVIRPDATEEDLVWTEVTTGIWQTTILDAKSGYYKFFVECGTTGVDEFDYLEYNYEKSGGIGLEPLYIILISAFGLAGWYLIQKLRRK